MIKTKRRVTVVDNSRLDTGTATASYGYRAYGAADAELTKGDLNADNPLNALPLQRQAPRARGTGPTHRPSRCWCGSSQPAS